jgi:pimeloyl-ACP methyl ester carboxylesterase
MGMVNRGHLSDLRGVVRLAVDATVGVTDLVEKMHHTIQLRHPPLGESQAGNTGGLTGFVYNSIRGTTRFIGRGLDAGMAPVTALLPEGMTNATRDAFVSVINGVYGDHLANTCNPLAIEMGLRYSGRPIDPEEPAATLDIASTGKILLFVHGLCLNDENWKRDGRNHSEALANELGYTPLYLRYNSGLPIAQNGRMFAGILEKLLDSWPHPVSEISLVGHSLGGLVVRSAYHHGDLDGHNWLKNLRKMIFIGTPHHGAPLERGGKRLDYLMELSPYAAPFTGIGKKRSAGISDLHHGSITSATEEFVPLPTNVECFAMAATLAKKRSRIAERLIGDGLVPLDSALGRHKDQDLTLAIPEDRQWVGFETSHMGLLGSPGPYTQLAVWLA